MLLAGYLSLSACSADDSPLPLVGTLTHERLELVAESQERINEIVVREGQHVEIGQVLVQLDDSMAQARVAEARAIGERVSQRLAELVRGPRKERIQEAQAHLTGAEKHLLAQQREYDRNKTLVARQLVSPSDLDRVFDLREVAKAQRDEATAKLAELLEGTTTEQLAQARASVAESQARLEQLKITAQRLVIHAPRAGRIESLPYEVGERPPKGAAVVVMLSDAPVYARVYVPASIRASVRAGMQASIHLDGFEQPLQGEVRYISADASFTPYYALTQRDRSRLVYLTEVVIMEGLTNDLPSGLPVEVNFPELK
jgi:HlyD family secretion protein